MFVQLVYSVSVFPCEGSSNPDMFGRLTVGTWSFKCASLKPDDVIQGMKKAWADPIIQRIKGEDASVVDHMNLNALRQVKHVLGGNNRTLKSSTYQLLEPFNSGHLSLVHNIQLTEIPT